MSEQTKFVEIPHDQLDAVNDYQIVRVTRTIVVEGQARWVRGGLDKAACPDVGDSKVGMGVSCTAMTIEVGEEPQSE